MKKLMLAAGLLVGAGVATSRADVSVGISVGHHDRGTGRHVVVPAPHVVIAPPRVVIAPPVIVANSHDAYHHREAARHEARHHEMEHRHEHAHSGW